jgi:DGQHR domain-containing protein
VGGLHGSQKSGRAGFCDGRKDSTPISALIKEVKYMPRQGRFDDENDYRLYLNWARDKITNWEGSNWVAQDSMDLIEDELELINTELTTFESHGFPGDPIKAYEIFDRLRTCARNQNEFSWGASWQEQSITDLKDASGRPVGHGTPHLTSSQLLRDSGIIQHRYSAVPDAMPLDLVGFEQDGVKGYMGFAPAGSLDAVCSVPWMDPNLSSSEFSNKLLNGQLDENKWQRVVDHDRIKDIRNFADTPGKNLFNPVLLYTSEDKIEGADKLNGRSTISVPFTFLKERRGEFHDYLPFPHEVDLRPIWALDGQHRIRGFGSSARGSKLMIPFVLLIGKGTPEDAARCALIFTEINTRSEPLDDLHKIYLNYQFAMEGQSISNDYSVKYDDKGSVLQGEDGTPIPTQNSRPLRRAYELALFLASDSDSPLHDCVEFQKPPGQKRKNHIVVNAKNFIDVTSKWFKGSKSVYGDWKSDEYHRKEVMNFFIAFKNVCNQWDEGPSRWETGQGKNKQLLQFEGPFLSLLNIAEYSISSLIEKGETDRPFTSDNFEDLLDPLMWVDWKSGLLAKSKLRGRTNQNIKHLTLWMTTAIENGTQCNTDETINPDIHSMPGKGLLAAPDVVEAVEMSGNSWPALYDLEFKVETPCHTLKVSWEMREWDGKRYRDVDIPNDATTHPKIDIKSGYNNVEHKLVVSSNILSHNSTKFEVRPSFSNAVNTVRPDWKKFTKPSE